MEADLNQLKPADLNQVVFFLTFLISYSCGKWDIELKFDPAEPT